MIAPSKEAPPRTRVGPTWRVQALGCFLTLLFWLLAGLAVYVAAVWLATTVRKSDSGMVVLSIAILVHGLLVSWRTKQ